MLPRPTFSALRPSGGKAREVALGNLAKSLLLAGIEDSHEMARKTFRQHPAIKIVEPFIVERRGKGPQPRLVFAHRHEADHGAEHKPGRRFILISRRWPGETHTADKPAVYPDGIGPIEADRLLGRRACGKRVAERANPRIYRAPRGPQRFLGLQHHGKFREVEAPDVNQRPGSILRRDGDRMCESVADLA